MAQIDLPDFDDMQKVIEKMSDLSLKIELLKLEIEVAESEIVTTCMTDTRFFVGGKPPSMSLITSTFARTGLNGELVPKRQELAKLESLLEVLRRSYDLMKSRIDVWRSLQANERASVM